MSYTPAGYVRGRLLHLPFPGRQRLDRPPAGARPDPRRRAGTDCRDVVTARVDYARLDRPGQRRCASACPASCVRARNIGDPAASRGVEIAYARGGQVFAVQGEGLRAGLVEHDDPLSRARRCRRRRRRRCTSWSRRRWSTPASRCATGRRSTSWASPGSPRPGGYHTSFRLNWPVDIGGYTAERSPDKPILVHMTRTPCQPGLPEFDQNRAGRAELLATPFETFEREIRDQLGRTLAGGGFDPAARHHRHHRQPLAARLCAGIERAVGSGAAARAAAQRHRPRPVRPHRHRQLRRRRAPPTPTAPSTRPGARWTNCCRRRA